ncbi:MAG: DUF4173 domain-containing protein [Flavobacteriales bacterium]|nr:DUF4173 domain-containing protein [Flavobacteriales bacterium]
MTAANQTLLSKWMPLIIILLAAIVFDQLFHDRALGVNLFLFHVLIIGLIVQRVGWRAVSIPARWAGVGALIAVSMVVVHHSIIAGFMAIVSIGLFAALAHESALRSVPFGYLQLAANYIMLPVAAVEGTGELIRGNGGTRAGWRWIRLVLIPLAVALIFFQLYRVGNPKFDQLTAGFLDGFFQAIGDLLEWIFTPHALFFIWGAIVCAGLIFRFAPRLVPQWEEPCSDLLKRVRSQRPHWMAPRSMDPLERERRMGMVLLVLVNALLLAVNVIDISWVWIGFEVPENFSLKQFVHEGTWILIISIFLSMLILLHLFRRNQNFYVRSAWLRILGLVWVGQNLVLGVSVFLRNYHYISFHGLAYKRIGVIAFLVLVLIGLITLYIKILKRRSLFYLARVNAWAAFALLIGMTTVDWDSFIVRTNLRHSNPGEIDIDNYLAMSDKVLPLLYANLDLVQEQMARHSTNRVRWVEHLDPVAFRADLDAKRDRFLLRIQEQHWQEWNMADVRTRTELAELSAVGTP